MLKEKKEYYLIQKNSLYIPNNEPHLIKLEKNYEALDFCLDDIKKALYKYYFTEDHKPDREDKKMISEIIKNLEKDFVIVERTIKENNKKFRYISNKVIELQFIKWWD